ncbi:hypothetical protein [Nonomuraea roseoviolacea]|uniref:Glycosyltransferase RgtA/B/C/D-like domain-containing protein n=1 Tax=Nonomuraea roseoviolacea subsp. carminata TaxID=160689 RepID=A0ABT1K587_9ACTN|nr:hypothetical protein [Nonomuraea roseoviolacea]MCP2349169.1 hypothetical protein [Nonomuraea roseoviolacea subsp. carminata]
MLTTAFTVLVLHHYGVSFRDIGVYGAYVVACVAVPGVLLLRALYDDSRTLAEEVALGTALGLAVEVGAYVAARAAGVPLLVLAWPAATYVLFLAVPALRRHWRSRGARPAAPAWWPWAPALVICYLVARTAQSLYAVSPLTWPDLVRHSDDAAFHLGLIGELKHHMPPTSPIVAGEPLFYHWFVYADWAAASWITGVEPLVLLLRLGMLPVLAAFVVLVASLARRVTGSWKGAAVAVGASLLIGPPRLYLGSLGSFTWGGVHDAAWGSPTFGFAALLFLPVVLLVTDLLQRRRYDARAWLLLGVFLLAVMGAKATFLPMLLVGLAAVAAVEVARRRRPSWPVVTALLMTAACLGFAQIVLFGARRQGLLVAPFSSMRTMWQDLTGAPVDAVPSAASWAGVAAVYLLAWAVTWSPVLGLFRRPALFLRPDVVLMLAIGAAGLGAMIVFDHPGRSQVYFLWGSYPFPAIIAVFGALVALRRARVSRAMALGAIGAGLACAYGIPFLCRVRAPLEPGRPGTDLYLPYLALLVVAALGALAVVVTRAGRRGWALMIVALAAVGLPAAHHARVVSFLSGHGASPAAAAEPAPTAPPGALTAARWLRDHSAPDDVVATNVHCRWGFEHPCDSRQFWLSGLTERHMLVEGWAFTVRNADSWQPGRLEEHQPFWDRDRFAANQAVFRAPSEGAMRRLRDAYGVRWLLVDERLPGVSSGLGDVARLRFRSGDFAVYEPGTSGG